MGTRAQAIDVARGTALVAMIAYHACWFAADAELVPLDLQALGWHLFQRSIAASFFLLVGVSLALARPSAAKAAGRIARIAACALLVTATSFVLDPQRVVTFGTRVRGGEFAPSDPPQVLLQAPLEKGASWTWEGQRNGGGTHGSGFPDDDVAEGLALAAAFVQYQAAFARSMLSAMTHRASSLPPQRPMRTHFSGSRSL